MYVNQQKTGKVIVAGAGPGDEELITVKLQKRLSAAAVIIADRLVNPAIIELYASPAAEIIFAGKQGYHEASFSQEEVTSLLLKYALGGKNVLRLKGGDVAFFSNVLDELTALHKAGISYEIIPGITAASGASAYTGIPLTARGYAQGVQFLSYQANNFYSPEKWETLSNTTDTLVFYMAGKNIAELAALLVKFAKNPDKALAVIEQATTVHQQIHCSSIKNCLSDFAGKQFSSPSLIIVGDVVTLHHQFAWFLPEGTGSVFQSFITESYH